MITKRADITSDQFRQHYETVHAPLVDRLLPFYSLYRRNYVDDAVRRGRAESDCDVFTELEFATEADYDAWLETLAKPDVLAQIRADEANFLDSRLTRMWRVSPFASSYGEPRG